MSPLRQFIVYGIGGAASRLAAIFLVPLYTRTLSVEEYGRLEVALAVHTGIVLLAGLQVESGIARDIYEARAKGQRLALAWTSFALTCAGSAAALVLLCALAATGWVTPWVDSSALVVIALMTLPAQFLGVQLVMLRFEGRALRYATLSLLDLLLAAAFSLWFMVSLRWGIAGALAGILAAKCICVLLAWPQTLRAEPGAARSRLPSREWAHRLLTYGVPALPAVLVSWIQNAGSRLFTAAALAMHDVAIAALAVKVAAIFGFIVYSLRLAWEPHSIARLDRHAREPEYYRLALEWYVIAMFVALGVAALTVPWAVGALAPATYTPAIAVAIVAVVAQYWTGIGNMAVIGIQGARQMNRMFPVYAWGAIVNVTVLFALAPLAGPSAVAIGMLAGAVTSSMLAAHISNLVFDTRFPMRLLLASLTACILLATSLVTALSWVGGNDHRSPTGHALAWIGGGTAIVLVLALLLAVLGLERARRLEMWQQAASVLAARARRR